MEQLIWFFATIAVGLFALAGVIVAIFSCVKLAVSQRSVASFLMSPVLRSGRFPEKERAWVGIRNRAYLTLMLCAVAFILIVIFGSYRGFEMGVP